MTLYSIKVTKTVEKSKKSIAPIALFTPSQKKLFSWIKIYWPIVILVSFFSLFYLVYINLLNSDIGRHIANGREFFRIFQNGLELKNSHELQKLLSTNYYSYTETNFPFVNHHWLFGIGAFILHEIGGFTLITFTNILINSTAFIFILSTAICSSKKKIKFIAIIGFLFMPLITARTEVRPESISLLFFSFYYFLFSTGILIRKKWLIAPLIFIQIIWTNSHLFFILGPLLAGYFLFENVLVKLFERKSKNLESIIYWLIFFLILLATSLLNPHTWSGLLAPLNIFNNYSYRVAENQSTFFMIHYGINIHLYLYFILSSFFAFFLGVFALINKNIFINEKNKFAQNISQLTLLIIFIILANKIHRMSPFLGVIMIPFIVRNAHEIIEKLQKKVKKIFQNPIFLMIGSSMFFLFFIVVLKLGFFLPSLPKIGIGLLPENQISAKFFIENNLQGPIFNNYDIGGYLAYNIFPKEKLFLDNRPEAYSDNFLTNEYLDSLKNENTWGKISDKYKFNVIFFYRHDQMDGAQQFLYNRVTDSEWVPVFVDNYVLILVKNTENNKNIIEKFRLPQEMFVMSNE